MLKRFPRSDTPATIVLKLFYLKKKKALSGKNVLVNLWKQVNKTNIMNESYLLANIYNFRSICIV